MNTILTLIILTIVLIGLDYTYMTINKSMFVDQIIKIQNTTIIGKPIGFILCYLFIILGLYYFIIKNHKTPLDAFLLGLFVYGVFELTNYSLLKNWSLKVVVIDTLWGGILFFITTFLFYKIEKWIR